MLADAEATLSLALLHLHALQHGLVLSLLLLEGSNHHVIILLCKGANSQVCAIKLEQHNVGQGIACRQQRGPALMQRRHAPMQPCNSPVAAAYRGFL